MDQTGTTGAARGALRGLSLYVVLLTGMLLPSSALAVDLSLPAVEAIPGETVRVPMTLTGLSDDEILSLNIEVRFDMGVLPKGSMVPDRRGALISAWSLASNMRLVPAGQATEGQLLMAGATATSAVTTDGTLLFIDISVPQDAVIGTSSPLTFTSSLFNDGVPAVTPSNGSLTVIAPRLKADFDAHPLEGAAPLQVRFVDKSSGGAEQWLWSFGDGGSSTESSPLYVYETAGDYTVSLTVTGASATATETKEDYVKVLPDQQPPAIVEGPIARGITHSGADIFWKTNEAGDSQVEYCGLSFRPTTGNTDELMAGLAEELADADVTSRLQRGTLSIFTHLDCGRATDERQQTNHNIRLADLSPATVYVYRVRSADEAGNASNWRGGIFITRLRPDNVSPKITWGPHVTVTPQRAQVRWKTNEPGNSFVSISTNSGFSGDARITVDELVIDHRVWVDVQPGQTYYVRVRSTDGSGNSSSLKRTSFRTPRTDSDAPVLLNEPTVIHRTASTAVIYIPSNEPITVRVDYGLTEDYGGSVASDDLSQQQRVLLNQLQPRTLYHFRVVAYDASGNESESADFSFVTRDKEDDDSPDFTVRPYVLKGRHNGALIAWETDEDATAIIEYGLSKTFGERLEIAAAVRRQQQELTDLSPGTEYYCRVLINDLAGNGPVASKTFKFRTVRDIDTLPPVLIGAVRISRRTESGITVEWHTDEASTSHVDFGTDAADLARQAEDDELTTSHSVTLTHLLPATTVFLQVSSTDAGNNTVTSAIISATTRRDDSLPDLRILSGPEVVARTATTVVIEWLTDRPATSAVEYGTTANFGDHAELFERTRRHRVVLTGLAPATSYFFQATSSDGTEASGVSSRVGAVTTRADADTRAPGLRHITLSSTTSTSALVTWLADEPAGGWVEVGTASGNYHRIFGGAHLERRQQVLITGLTSGSTYHYRLRSVDAAGNETFSEDRTLHTGHEADRQPPRFVERPSVVSSHATATFVWRTNESCYGSVIVGAEGTLGSADEEVFEEERSGVYHRLTVTGLQAGRRYQFAILSSDLSGNTTVFGDRRPGSGKVLRPEDIGGVTSFTTDTDVDQLPPVFVNAPREISRSDTEVLIGWETDEVSDTRLYLVEANGSESLVEFVPEHDFSHQALLTGLTPGTTYSVVAASIDPANNGPLRSAPLTFTTPVRADATPPSLATRPEVVALSDDAVTLRWQTDEAARAVVTFGVADLDQRVATTEPAIEQDVQLNDLLPGTKYRYEIAITDGSGNTSSPAANGTFTTSQTVDTQPPTLSKAPVAGQLQPTTATVSWSTDEGADGFVRFGSNASNLDRILGTTQVSRDHTVQLTNLQPATTYFYQASSADAWGNGPTTASTASFTTPATVSALTVPTGLRAMVGAHGVVRLRWNATETSGWLVYRSQGQQSFSAIAGPLSQASYADAGVTTGGDVSYQITAVGSDGSESAASDPVTLSVSLTAGDFDGSGRVDFDDFFLLVERLGRRRADAGFDAAADFDGDGEMTLNDVFAFVDLFGTRYSRGRSLATRVDLDADASLQASMESSGDWSVAVRGPTSTAWGLQFEYDDEAMQALMPVAAAPGTGHKVFVVRDEPGQFVLVGLGADPAGALATIRFVTRQGAGPASVHLTAAHGIDLSQRAWRANSALAVELRPASVELLDNRPNPFNPSTQIRFQLPREMPVWLTIYDALGQVVARPSTGQNWIAGVHALTWDGQDAEGRPLASGFYFSLLQTPSTRHTGKLLLLR
jgi:PKD repeat protein